MHCAAFLFFFFFAFVSRFSIRGPDRLSPGRTGETVPHMPKSDLELIARGIDYRDYTSLYYPSFHIIKKKKGGGAEGK